MPTPQPNPLRVAECGACQQLFAVYATDGVVACPSCSAPVEVAGLETAPLGIAEPIEVRVEAPAPTVPAGPEAPAETVTLAETAVADRAPVEAEPAAEEGPPTVAEWLMRQDEPAPAAPAEKKPTLSESLGWKESLPGFDPPPADITSANSAPSAGEALAGDAYAPAPTGPAPADSVTQPADEFRFDFGATPLDETSSGLNLEVGDSPVGQTPEEPEQAQPAELSWDAVGDAPKSRGRWLAPLGSLAGLALIGAAVGFWLYGVGPDDEVALSANRGSSRLLAPERDTEPTPPDPFPGDGPIASDSAPDTTVPPPEPRDSLPIVDPEARPATFDAPSPARDPLAELPPAAPRAAGRYSAPAAAPLDELPPAAPLAETRPAEPAPLPVAAAQPAAQPRVGLIGAPRTTVDELRAAVSASGPSGQAFAAGDLSDPEQVPALGQHYAQLSYLAQVLTTLDPAEKTPQRSTAEMLAVDVFDKLFREARPREQSRQVARQWIAWSGRPHGGVFFAGEPTRLGPAGEVMRYEYQVGDTVAPVVMAESLDVNRFLSTGATSIGVIGVVVEEPRKWIAGYEGDDERVVWARKIIPLRDPIEL